MQNGREVKTSFESCLTARLTKPGTTTRVNLLNALAALPYEEELTLKDEAFADFWAAHRLPGVPEPVVASPRPRHYRTTSKRKGVYEKGAFQFLFSEDGEGSPYEGSQAAFLEPVEHAALYRLLLEWLNLPGSRPLAKAINFVVIRGDYERRHLLFNVAELDGSIVRQLKSISAKAMESALKVVGCYVVQDETRSRYYLDSGREKGAVGLKVLAGRQQMELRFNDFRYRLPPIVFSQVNHSMVPIMLEAAEYLLEPKPTERLLDLYCGYGLFTCALASKFGSVVGVEGSPESVHAAIENGALNKTGKKLRVYQAHIGPGTLEHLLKPTGRQLEKVFTDPPRQGMNAQAIVELCERRPECIVLASCGTDVIPVQVGCFADQGYTLKHTLVLDMFPATPHLESLLIFTPK